MMKRNLLIAGLLMLTIAASAQVSAILGDWQTVDDKTGEKKSVVSVYQGSDGLYYGKITKMLLAGAKTRCEACTGDDHNAPIEGLLIIRGMKYDKDDNQLVGGQVLDPESGKFYYAKIYPKDGQLILRGSLDKRGFIGRNQTWLRAK